MSASRIILVTGANTGLGLEAVRAIYKSEAQASTILLCGRSLEKAVNAVKLLEEELPSSAHNLVAMQLDIQDDASISAAYHRVESEYGHLDVLVNNAGASFDQEIPAKRMTLREAWNATWDVNVTSTHALTFTMIPLLLKSNDPRLLFITSGTSSLNETLDPEILSGANKPADPGWPKSDQSLRITAYRSSKSGLNMLMREWVKLLHHDPVKVFCISPGFLATGFGGSTEELKKMGAIDPSIGGEFIRDVVDGKRDTDVGKVIRKDSTQPW